MPPNMTFEQAAALPQAGALAMQALLANGPLQPGQKILINGAGGGVGTIGVQVAKMRGAEVTGADHGSKLAMMRRIGFDYVIDYRQEDFTKSGKRYDLILDAKTNRPLVAYLRSLAPGGAYVTVGGETARLFRFLILGGLVRPLTGKKIAVIKLKQNAHLADLKDDLDICAARNRLVGDCLPRDGLMRHTEFSGERSSTPLSADRRSAYRG